MTPGPTLIMKAPGCKVPLKFSTIGSGNTFGATFWTDGKCEAPMLPDDPWLKKSPTEGVLFWSDECEEIGQIRPFAHDKENREWQALEYAEEPNQEDYFNAITNGVAQSEEQVRYVRMRLWWLGNDPIREGKQEQLDDLHIRNLRELSSILKEDNENQRLMKAEALRELSLFDDALKLLDWDFPDDYQASVDHITTLAKNKDCKVTSIS